MEPCFVSTEDVASPPGNLIANFLQWSRASSARKTARVVEEWKMERQPSMEPCFVSTEDFGWRYAVPDAVSAELSKNASIPRTSLHHVRTRGRDQQLCRREDTRLANGFASALVDGGDASVHFQLSIRLISEQGRRK